MSACALLRYLNQLSGKPIWIDPCLDVQVIDVNRSPVGSTFGYYTAGRPGTTLSVVCSVCF